MMNKTNPMIAAKIKMYEKINNPIIKRTIINPIIKKGMKRIKMGVLLSGLMIINPVL